MTGHNVYRFIARELQMEEAGKLGRPTKFTPERCDAIVQDIADAIPYHYAALANGIAESTLFDWISHGLDDIKAGIDSEFALFSERIKTAERNRIKLHSNKITANIERWQGDAWMLERRWYKHYGSNVHLHELEDRMKKVEENSTEGNESNGK